jgi:hypothetical protein
MRHMWRPGRTGSESLCVRLGPVGSGSQAELSHRLPACCRARTATSAVTLRVPVSAVPVLARDLAFSAARVGVHRSGASEPGGPHGDDDASSLGPDRTAGVPVVVDRWMPQCIISATVGAISATDGVVRVTDDSTARRGHDRGIRPMVNILKGKSPGCAWWRLYGLHPRMRPGRPAAKPRPAGEMLTGKL